MMLTIVGYALLVIAAGWFLYKLVLAFNSMGGTDLMLVVYDAAVYPPLLAAGGLFLVLKDTVTWPYWAYLAIWVGLTAFAAAAIKLSEEIGDRRLK